MQVKVFSTPTCPYCRMAKEYLKKNNITYEDVDVSQNRAAGEEMVKLSGQMGVPVIMIDSNVIIGFDKDRIDELIKPS